jgi:large subunit ribosomal protein L5
MNPMQEIKIGKVTLNMGCAGEKTKIDKAEKFLQKLTNQKPYVTSTHKRTTFGSAKGKPMGVKVTLRRESAERVLKDAFEAVENRINSKQVNGGNFSFGVKESIDLPNIKYDPDIGIVGLDVCVTLERPGFRVKKRSVNKSKIGKKHLITKQQTIKWLKDWGVEVVG